MSTLEWVLLSLGALLVLYVVLVLALYLAAGRQAARAAAGFVPDCLVLFRRLVADPRVSGWRKALLVLLVAYLGMPFDLVPDFIPVVGHLDDVLIVVLVLRAVLRGGGEELIREHWPGPDSSLSAILRLAYGKAALSA
jgi:uncharacterized membrane protein YkvA (DUF1232 family)